MSTTIDQRVVEMQFNNKQFESGVATSMSTLDKLKNALKLNGATKGLENVGAAAKNVNMSPLSNAVETVGVKFDAMAIMGKRALENIVDSAYSAGKKIISALTIDPVKTGFQEYETQINATQTILSNTKSKGSDINDVNKALEELNLYADKTIYNFTEMTRNIGTFTAAGIDLDTSVNAIQGIANLAAVSGSTSQQASTAMYQLSQALASGTVKLMDWNSVVNAGMGGEMFQNALRETSELLGTGAEAAIKAEGSFRDSLRSGWLTSEVLTETLKKFTSTGANERVAEYTGLTKEAVTATLESAEAQYGEADAIDHASKALAEKSGKSAEEIKSILEFAKDAEDAATKVKTFTQMWDVMKESAQSGWSQTWKIIFGDFEKAKDLFTPLTEYLTGFIGKMNDARNNLLEGALNFPNVWKSIMDKLSGGGLANIQNVVKSVGDMTNKLTEFQDVVNNVWRGDFGTVDTGRFELLEKAGYDHRVIQDLVNKGYQYKITVKDIEASHKKFGLTLESNTKSTEKVAVSFEKLSEEELRNAGLTEDEIKLYQDLAKEADRTGKSISELVDEMSKTDGRTLLLDSFKNIGQPIVAAFKAIKDAWLEIFPPMSVVQLYDIIKGFNEFTKKLVISEDSAKKLQSTFKGVFAALDIVLTLTAGPLKIAFKLLSSILGMFDMNILDLTGNIGDAIVSFRDWLDGVLDFESAFKRIKEPITNTIKRFKDWIAVLKESKNLPRDIANGIINGLSKAFNFIKGIFTGSGEGIFGGFESIPDDLISGLVNGIQNGAKLVWQTLVELGKTALAKLKEVLGIHSPSTKGYEIGRDIILGIWNGIVEVSKILWTVLTNIGRRCIEVLKSIANGSGNTSSTGIGKDLILGIVDGIKTVGSLVWEALITVFQKAIDIVKAFDPGSVIAAVLSTGMLAGLLTIAKTVKNLTSPLEGLSDLMEGANKVLNSFSGMLGGLKFKLYSEGVKSLAIAIAILAGSLVILSTVNQDNLWSAVGALGTMIVSMIGLISVLAMLANYLGKAESLELGSIATMLLGLATALLIMGFALKQMAGIKNIQQANECLMWMAVFIGFVIGMSKVAGNDVDKIGKMFLKLSIAMGLLILVAKLIAKLSPDEMIKGGVGIAALGVVIAGLIAATKLAGKDIDKIGGTLIKIALAIGILALAAKLIASMSWEEMKQAGIGILALSGVIVALIAATKLAGKGKHLAKIGSAFAGIAAAFIALALVAKIIAGMSWGEMGKAAVGITALSAIIAGLIAATKLAGNKLERVGSTILMISVAIGILGVVATLLSLMPIEQLAKGVIAVGILSAMMALLITATKNAQNCKGNLIVMTVVIAVLTASIVGLSMLDSTKLTLATVALSVVIGMFTLLVGVAGTVKGAVSTLIIMTVAVGLLGGMLYLLSGLPIESTLGAAAALSVLLLSLSVSTLIMSKMGAVSPMALAAMVTMTAVVGALGLILWALRDLPVESAMGAAASLSVLLLSLSVSTLIMSKMGAVSPMALASMGVMTAVVGALALVLWALRDLPVESATGTATALSAMLLAMSASLGVLTVIGLGGPAALIGIGSLAAMIVGIGGLITAIGYLVTEFPMLETFLNKGIPILGSIGTAIGTFFGNVVGGFAAGALSTLPQIGASLSAFMTSATPFIEGCKTVDSSVLAAVGILAGAVLALTAVDLITGLVAFASNAITFSLMGTQLSAFMTAAMPFIHGAKLLNTDMMAGVKALAETILILTQANILDGLTRFITGGSSLGSFGAQLGSLGLNLNQFATNLGTFDDAKITTVRCAAEAIKIMASAANEIPNEGGWLAKLVGDNSIATFGGYLPGLGTNLSQFATNLGTFTEAQVTSVSCAANAIKEMASAAKDIPNEGGWIAKLVGDNSIATFGGYLPGLGTNLSLFATNLGTFSDAQVTTVKCAATAIKEMSQAAKGIDGQAEWAKKLFGDNSLAAFGSQLGGLGTNLKAFATNLGTFGAGQVSTINSAISAIKAFSALAETDLKSAKKNLDGFGDKMADLGSDIADFVENLPGSGSIASAIGDIRDIIKLVTDIGAVDKNAASNFTNSLKELGKDGVKNFADAFSSLTSKNDVQKAAAGLVTKAVDGIKNNQSKIKSQAETAAGQGVTGIRNKYTNFYNAGSYLVDGFKAGISENTWKATAQAKAMAEAAAKAAKEALKINSPSKVFRSIGSSIPEGFAMGIEMYGSDINGSANSMAKTAINSVSKAIGDTSDMINSSIDAQPTIRPVIDLTDVESGADAITRIFGSERSVGVMANVNAVSSMMNGRSQNGVNDDVVSAINQLSKQIENLETGDTYSINGITYDDGSNIANAMNSIVRACRLQGRS